MLRKLLKKRQLVCSLDLDSRTSSVRNSLTFKGKKSKAEKAVLRSLLESSRSTGKISLLSGLSLLDSSFDNICPNIGVKYNKFRRKKTATPQLISTDEKNKLGVKWLCKSLHKVKRKPVHTSLSSEILGSLAKRSGAYKLKLEHYKIIKENRNAIR